MGLFNFIKSSGAKIFGASKNTRENSAKVSGDKNNVTVDNRNEEKEENERASRKLEETIKDLNLKATNLNISIEDDQATVTGLAQDQSTKEKIILIVGNVEGIATVDDQMEVANKEPEAVFHTVERGDTLSKIAQEHYGSANKYQEIFDANKPMLTHPDKIYPGQVLRVPVMKK